MTNPGTSRKTVPYGLWESNVTVEGLVDQAPIPAYPFKHRGRLYWLEPQPLENGRIGLMQEVPRGKPICITPEKYNIRTAVHEYGGSCFCVVGDNIVFNNYEDGKLYMQSLDPVSEPRLLIRNQSTGKCIGFADLVASGNLEFVVAVMEIAQTESDNKNCIVALPIPAHPIADQFETIQPEILAEGMDFYANPVISDDNKKIAWFDWTHPFMPWDQSRLVWADLSFQPGHISIQNPETIIDEGDRSVCQLGFLNDGRLLFASDSDTCDYWNIFQHYSGNTSQVTHGSQEFGEAHWAFGQRRWQRSGTESIIAVATFKDGDKIVDVDCNSGGYTVLHQGFSACNHLQIGEPDEILFIARYPDKRAQIACYSIEARSLKSLPVKPVPDNAGYEASIQSVPRLIEFPAGNDRVAYAYYYPPVNSGYTAPEKTLPPLMVIVHGGPTGRTTSELSDIKQYFCSLGFALLDVNHRGSTGYGRKFRQSLLGHWGEFDAEDIASAIKFVAANNWIDKDNVFIRGSSAGGYAVLRSLTRTPRLFAGGACYYGIGNLVTLCEITHKFESRYTDRLVGESYSAESSSRPDSRFVTRSPVFQIDKLTSPLIIFQGEIDKVVPPDVSREVVALLKTRGIKHSYTEYPGEGHGFRQTFSRVDSLRRETAFFAEIIKSKLIPDQNGIN